MGSARLLRCLVCSGLAVGTVALAQLHVPVEDAAPVFKGEACPPVGGAIVDNQTDTVGTVFESYKRNDTTVVVARSIPAGTRWVYQHGDCGDDPNCKTPMPDKLRVCIGDSCEVIYNCLSQEVSPIIEVRDGHEFIVWGLDDPTVEAERIAGEAMDALHEAGLSGMVTVEVD